MTAHFDGATYSHEDDHDRLDALLEYARCVLLDGEWHYKEDFTDTGHDWASMSARIRDLRKPKFGAYDIQSECVGRGRWRFRYVRSVTEPRQLALV